MTDKKTLIASNVPSDVVGVVTACQEWHAHRIAQLKSLADAPEDMKLVIEAGGERLELDGKVRGGFIAGILCAMALFEKFPLTVTKPSKEFLEGCEAGWNFENEEA